MKVLHTSDWHLGRSFHREDLLSAQAAFVDHLVETVRAERVDVVAVSGDIYDRALPSVDAVELCNEALARLAATGARLVLISGNHDSAQRLGFGSALLDSARVHVRTDPRSCGTPVLHEDTHGVVAFYPLPYLEPDAVRTSLDCEERSHSAVLTSAMTRVRSDLSARSKGTRSVVLAHAFVAGGEGSDSERDISVGGALLVSPSVFDGISYTALGHLHGAQQVRPTVRYSGSPLAYSFSEANHTKSTTLIELGRRGVTSLDIHPSPTPRDLARIRGRFDDLLTNPRWAKHEDSWLSVVLTDAVRPREPMERLRGRFPHVLVLGFEPDAPQPPRSERAVSLTGRTDFDVACSFVGHVRGEGPDVAESALLREAIEQSCSGELAEVGR